jgi:hypothetical protein
MNQAIVERTNMTRRRSRTRTARDAAARAILAAVLCCAVMLQAQPRHGFALLHPYFDQGGWLATYGRMRLETPGALDEIGPASVAVEDHAAACIGRDSSVYVMTVELARGCVDVLSFGAPARISGISPRAPWTPLALLGDGGGDTVRVVIAGQSLIEARLGLVDGAVYESTVLPPPGAGAIRFLDVERIDADSAVLWAAGDQGLLASAAITATGIDTWESFQLDTDEDILCYGDGYAGARSGAVYVRQGEAFSREATLSSPIRAISSRAACGDNGLVAWRRDGAWTTVAAPPRAWRYQRLSATAEGLMVETLDSAYAYRGEILGDSPTRIGEADPAELMQGLNGPAYSLDDTRSVSITLSDPEGNHELPRIWGVSRQYGHMDIFPPATPAISGRDPSANCIAGEAWLADSTFTIAISATPAATVAVRSGAADMLCFGCAWRPDSITASAPAPCDTLLLATSVDTIRIDLTDQATAVTQPHGRGAGMPRLLACAVDQSRIRLRVADPRGARTLALFDARGRCIVAAGAPVPASLTTPALARGAYLAVLRARDGRIRTRRIIIAE